MASRLMFAMKPRRLLPPLNWPDFAIQEKYACRSAGVQPALSVRRAWA